MGNFQRTSNSPWRRVGVMLRSETNQNQTVARPSEGLCSLSSRCWQGNILLQLWSVETPQPSDSDDRLKPKTSPADFTFNLHMKLWSTEMISTQCAAFKTLLLYFLFHFRLQLIAVIQIDVNRNFLIICWIYKSSQSPMWRLHIPRLVGTTVKNLYIYNLQQKSSTSWKKLRFYLLTWCQFIFYLLISLFL